jgi:diacylglycerol kinase
LLIRDEASFRIQLAGGLCIVLIGLLLHIRTADWIIVIILIGIVLALEAMNTAVEELCDHVTPEEHPKIGIVKDLAAAASAIFRITAIIVLVLVFLPYVRVFFS